MNFGEPVWRGNPHCGEARHPDATNLTRDFSPGNSDAMDILTLGLGKVLGLELGRQDVPGLKNTRVNFLASGQSRQDVADPIVAASIFVRFSLFLKSTHSKNLIHLVALNQITQDDCLL